MGLTGHGTKAFAFRAELLQLDAFGIILWRTSFISSMLKGGAFGIEDGLFFYRAVIVSKEGDGREDEGMLQGKSTLKSPVFLSSYKSLPKEMGPLTKVRCSSCKSSRLLNLLSKDDSHWNGCTSPITFYNRRQLLMKEMSGCVDESAY